MKRMFSVLCALMLVAACALVAGCSKGSSSDVQTIQGQWKVLSNEKGDVDAGTTIVVVFSDTQFKSSAITMDYSMNIDEAKVTFTSGASETVYDYAFEDGGKKLTLTSGDTWTKYEKVSDDGSAQPSVEIDG